MMNGRCRRVNEALTDEEASSPRKSSLKVSIAISTTHRAPSREPNLDELQMRRLTRRKLLLRTRSRCWRASWSRTFRLHSRTPAFAACQTTGRRCLTAASPAVYRFRDSEEASNARDTNLFLPTTVSMRCLFTGAGFSAARRPPERRGNSRRQTGAINHPGCLTSPFIR